jgi:hypothetical protein
MANKSFSEAFTANMTDMGLPVPTSLFGTLTTTLGTVGAIAGAIAKVGAEATVAEIFLTLPLGAGTAATAAATGEVVAVVGGLAASFYVGACIGSVLVAAYDTLDLSELATVLSWARDLGKKLGSSVSAFLKAALARHAQLSPIRESQVLARRAGGAPVFTAA